MRLYPLVSSVLLRLAAIGGSASGSGSESQLSPSAIDSAPPTIEEQYIRCQTNGGVTAFSSAGLQWSAGDPCPDGSNCNSLGQCDYRDVEAVHDVGSKDSSQSCSRDLCCSQFSLCGASEFFCRNLTASDESLPCQKGFGNCGTTSNKGSGSTSRWASYYEGWNIRRQSCDKVWPAQIDTNDVKQLVFSFATIDPKTFAVGSMHPGDEKLYADFLDLKDSSQKWIGIGGWKLPDAGPTHQTWTLIASSKANRSVFTSSLLDFLQKWDFAGVDINWEWHGADTLGGDAAIEKQNLVDLVKELRAALGSRGLSVVLPAHLSYAPCTDGDQIEPRAPQQDPATPVTTTSSTRSSTIIVSSESIASSTVSEVSSVQALSPESVETSTTSTMSLVMLSAEPALLSLQPWSAATTTSPLSSLTQIGNMTNTTTTANGTIPPVVPPVAPPGGIPPWWFNPPPVVPPWNGRPSLTCLEKDKTTVTDRYITCFEDLLLSPTTICTKAPLDLNNDEGDNPQPPRDSCSRAPLNLDDDEGDNEHPEVSCPRAPLLLDDDEGDNSLPDGPSCMRAPLSLDDDEGNNEMPEDTSPWDPLNPSNSTVPVPPPSTLSDFVSHRPPACPKNPPVNYETADPAGGFTTVLGLPSKTTTVTVYPTGSIVPDCPLCENVFDECVKTSCLQDGSESDACAKRCLAHLCYGNHNAPLCKKGFCRPAACPAQAPHDFNTAQPGQPFTTILSFPSTTMTVTATPTYGEPTLTHGPTPSCNAGHGTTPNGKWTVLFEHKIYEQPANATFRWDLWDENGCHAGDGMAWNQHLGFNISANIGTPERDMYKMDFELLTDVTDSFSRAESEIYFQISKAVGGCKSITKRDASHDATVQDAPLNPVMGIIGPALILPTESDTPPAPTSAPPAPPKPDGCYTVFKVNNREPDVSWQIVNDCAQPCGSQKLTTNDVNCESGVNKWQDNGDNPVSVRGGFCRFSMPFSTGNAGSNPAKWDRNSRWTLELIQNMEYETASIEWLLKDPDQNVAAHQIQDLSGPKEHKITIDVDSDTPEATKMRYKMLMTITEARNKDITQLKLTYQNEKNAWCDDDCPGNGPKLIDTCAIGALTACQPWYQTETSNEKKQSLLNYCYDEGKKKPCFSPMIYSNMDFSCDPIIDKWRAKNAGFERRFNCWWPYDFAVPYGLTDRPPNFKGASVDDNPDGFNDFTDAPGLMPDHGGANRSWANAPWR
ncbi:hypothetical protein E8E11_001215 [Didymella keratinophila]|nr:hypothetical protein E8E11_001215 [Didymella keratinophila]